MNFTANGNVFVFSFKRIKHASWVVEVQTINGEYDGYWFGEITSKPEAVKQAKVYAERYKN